MPHSLGSFSLDQQALGQSRQKHARPRISSLTPAPRRCHFSGGPGRTRRRGSRGPTEVICGETPGQREKGNNTIRQKEQIELLPSAVWVVAPVNYISDPDLETINQSTLFVRETTYMRATQKTQKMCSGCVES